MAIVLFGLTGGVASGKSTVATRFSARGIPLIDADAIAHQLVEPGTDGLAAVVAAFGAEVLGPDGQLDRRRLGARVFSDPAERKRLEGILHPRIGQVTRREARRLEQQGEPIACYEAALLVESGLADQFRPLVVVAASTEAQLERLRARDGLSELEARERIDSQLPLARKTSLADFVIDSSGTIEQTYEGADVVLAAIRIGVQQGRWPTSGG
jgi:dephospho-CoA kinase